MDSSGSIEDEGANNYNLLKEFIARVVERLPVESSQVRIALAKFSTYASLEFDYRTYFSKPELVDSIMKVSYDGGNAAWCMSLSILASLLMSLFFQVTHTHLGGSTCMSNICLDLKAGTG